MRVSLRGVEHVGWDEFHGRRQLAREDRYLFVEGADLLRELVDDLIRVGGNLIQKRLLKTKPP